MLGKQFACLLALALLVAPVCAQDEGTSSTDAFFKRFHAQKTVFSQFRFMTGVEAQADEDLQSTVAQMLATDYSFLGRPNDAVRTYPIRDDEQAPAGLPDVAGYEAMPAADWIASQAGGYRAIMVNEAHHVPQTRLLTLELLAKLRKLGFTHFAAETFALTDDPLAAGYPTRHTGYYTREPVFAELVREAKRLGYVLVPYEPNDEGGEQSQQERETGMAQILADLVKKHPDAKLLVHAGYGHIAKSPGTQPNAADPMAQEFIRLTGLPVLSITQTGLRWEDGQAAKRLAHAFGITVPSVLLARDDKRVWSEAARAQYDASVLLPAVDAAAIRPGWLTLGGRRKPVAIDLTPCIKHLPCLAEARYASEGEDAIPADQFVMLTDGEAGTPLYLAPGHYRLRLLGNDDAILAERSLNVSADSPPAPETP
ncbi:MAG: hypothetical protein KGL71_09205 [Xanthomonadaceae bacterium]|nr:hypothetical protein [Xanthomonadaceae bacterium]